MAVQQLAVVTGAGRGIGESMALRLRDRGFHVIAGVRKAADAERLQAPGIEPIQLDIREAPDIERVVHRVRSDPSGRRLTVLVNNAAAPLLAPLELVPLTDWRANFETNFFGHIAMTTALIPTLATSERSRIVNISSLAASLAGPGFGPYAVAKRALEAYSDILRRELRHSNIRVVIVQPAAVKTTGWSESEVISGSYTSGMTPDQRRRYDALIEGSNRTAARLAGGGVEAAEAARVIVDAIESRTPRPRYRIGSGAGVVAAATRLLGDRSMDRLLDRMIGVRPPRPIGA